MERRAHQRVLTHINALARVAGRSERVTVSDLSVQGCRIVTSHGFVAVGDPITLKFTEIQVWGDVVWQDQRNAGLVFRSHLHSAVVAHLGFEPTLTLQELPSLAERVRRASPGHSKSKVLSDPRDVMVFFHPEGAYETAY